ncbi:hypothetical protein [Planktosalinus lacus]|uniref:Lipocalin-like domain-containing protein n=1 Tax=Planktosalinus lacus TaxID=1526573 RepID=A0A8J2V9K1_9FLAO|nr:hypothetical protein [Planktosalinus lacus]GGD90129.1 hypothetical protein GCM10011312_12550 [Planktosalinus lacus]
MKTTYLILIALLCITTACTKDDKGQGDINIEGAWEVKATWDPYPEDSNTNWFVVNSDVDYYHTITFQDGLFNFNLINQQGYECYGEYTFEYDNEINKYRLYLNLSECNLGIYGWIIFSESVVELENNELIVFEGTNACDEGCGLKYKRLPI